MKKRTNNKLSNVSLGTYKILFIAFFLVAFTSKGWSQIYQHNFGTTTITTCPYTVAPSTLNANLSNSSWTNSTGAWTSYAGSAGQAIALSNSSGTPTITLTFTVANGYSLSLSSFSFWQQRSAAGAQNWSMTVNGTAVGSGTVPTTAANTGSLTPTNTISGLTGTITIIMSLSGATGTGTYRLDDYTLNGSVTACSPISSFPWSENFDGMASIGTDVTPSCWLTQPSAVWASMNAASITQNDPSSSPNYMTCYWDPYSSTNKYLITPGFALSSGVAYTFSFKWAGDTYSGWDADVRYNTTQTGVGSTLLGAAFLANGTTTTTAYTTVSRTFTPSSSGTYYFMVHVVNSVAPYYLGFDDFSVTAAASCASAPATQATGVSFSSTCYANSTISWTRGSGDNCAVFISQTGSGAAAPVDGAAEPALGI